MKTIKFILLFLVLFFTACSSKPFTKWSSPTMRVAIIAKDAHTYADVQNAIVTSGRFFVVDRSSGFYAALQEQDFNDTDRVDAKEKYARLGRMWGVGGVVVANVTCMPSRSFFEALSAPSSDCIEHLSLISTSTGEVVATAKDKVNTPRDTSRRIEPTPEWDTTVAKLNENIPTHFEKIKFTKEMAQFRDGKNMNQAGDIE